jgi:hypothetical protein
VVGLQLKNKVEADRAFVAAQLSERNSEVRDKLNNNSVQLESALFYIHSASVFSPQKEIEFARSKHVN